MRNLLATFLLMLTICPSIFASEYCPKSLVITDKQFSVPNGWHTTLSNVNSNDELLFYIAVYNFDHINGVNNNRISCVYKDRQNVSSVEITTDKTNYPKPDSAIWADLDVGSYYCFPEKAVDPNSCPWG